MSPGITSKQGKDIHLSCTKSGVAPASNGCLDFSIEWVSGIPTTGRGSFASAPLIHRCRFGTSNGRSGSTRPLAAPENQHSSAWISGWPAFRAVRSAVRSRLAAWARFRPIAPGRPVVQSMFGCPSASLGVGRAAGQRCPGPLVLDSSEEFLRQPSEMQRPTQYNLGAAATDVKGLIKRRLP